MSACIPLAKQERKKHHPFESDENSGNDVNLRKYRKQQHISINGRRKRWLCSILPGMALLTHRIALDTLVVTKLFRKANRIKVNCKYIESLLSLQ